MKDIKSARIDILMNEIKGLKQAHRDLKKKINDYIELKWWQKILNRRI